MRFTGDRPGNASSLIVAGSIRRREDDRSPWRRVGMHPHTAHTLSRIFQEERLAEARHAGLIREARAGRLQAQVRESRLRRRGLFGGLTLGQQKPRPAV
jgi:hypothetical protein